MSKHLAGHQLGSRLEHVGQLVTGTQSVQALEISLGAQRQAMQMLFEPQPDSYTHVALFCIHSLTVVVQMLQDCEAVASFIQLTVLIMFWCQSVCTPILGCMMQLTAP